MKAILAIIAIALAAEAAATSTNAQLKVSATFTEPLLTGMTWHVTATAADDAAKLALCTPKVEMVAATPQTLTAAKAAYIISGFTGFDGNDKLYIAPADATLLGFEVEVVLAA